MGGEIPGARLQQRIVAGPLGPIGHQGALGPLGRVVTPGLMGVVDHQQLAAAQTPATILQPGSQAGVEFAAPATRSLGAGLPESQGFELGELIRLQELAGFEPQVIAVQCHPLAAPERPVRHNPLHRQGIEHLMGQHNPRDGSGGQLGEAGPAPWQRAGLQLQPLARSHAGVGFHQHQLQPAGQLRPIGGDQPGQIQGQLALARARFHQAEMPIAGRQQRLQPVDQLLGQQGGEVAAEAGGGDEISRRADAQPAAAIGALGRVVEDPLHIGAEGHAAAAGIQPLAQPGGELSSHGTIAPKSGGEPAAGEGCRRGGSSCRGCHRLSRTAQARATR